MILPHGGTLTQRIAGSQERNEIETQQDELGTLVLTQEEVCDVQNIAKGVYSPLTGFLRREELDGVVKNMRLPSGIVWPIPMVLSVTEEEYHRDIGTRRNLLLVDQNRYPIALLRDVEVFSYEKDVFVENVFGTKDKAHPGVANLYGMGSYFVGGDVLLLKDSREPFEEYNFTPQETRELFLERGWESVVAFQTRNVPHRGHEFLQMEALQHVDGLFIQPVVGEKKNEDFKDEYILASYELLIEKYYPKERTLLGVLPLRMRYAGPREAVLHALIRKNFGCSHFIVGRDHAGVGKFYAPFAAQEIFHSFSQGEIGITILKYPEVVYCMVCGRHLFEGACAHEKISFSGTKLRESIRNKEIPPSYVIRPEVFTFLANSANSFVDDMYKNPSLHPTQGFVLWFTGLSQAGKTTLGDRIFTILKEKGCRVERLDGDLVREYLSRDLGFSKEDRDENIRRVGFVAKLLCRNGIGVICSFISPYRNQRDGVRKEVENFIEVFCNCPLAVCETRDLKGLYEKAKRGEIPNFTGVSDPYEEPESPEIEVHTDRETIDECTEKILDCLKERGFVSR
ncbi:MAG: sulfate adenylyltransferase [Patescibacteria group bacterium]